MQIFLRYDRSLTLDVHPADSVAGVKDAIASKTGLPADDVRLICAGKLLQDARTLAEHGVANHATVHLVLGLRGGKGGFGAMLRTAGARGVKTTNFDACRDLNGRRLRHTRRRRLLRPRHLHEWRVRLRRRLARRQVRAARVPRRRLQRALWRVRRQRRLPLPVRLHGRQLRAQTVRGRLLRPRPLRGQARQYHRLRVRGRMGRAEMRALRLPEPLLQSRLVLYRRCQCAPPRCRYLYVR